MKANTPPNPLYVRKLKSGCTGGNSSYWLTGPPTGVASANACWTRCFNNAPACTEFMYQFTDWGGGNTTKTCTLLKSGCPLTTSNITKDYTVYYLNDPNPPSSPVAGLSPQLNHTQKYCPSTDPAFISSHTSINTMMDCWAICQTTADCSHIGYNNISKVCGLHKDGCTLVNGFFTELWWSKRYILSKEKWFFNWKI